MKNGSCIYSAPTYTVIARAPGPRNIEVTKQVPAGLEFTFQSGKWMTNTQIKKTQVGHRKMVMQTGLIFSLCDRHCAKGLPCIILFNPQRNPMRQIIISPILQTRKLRVKRNSGANWWQKPRSNILVVVKLLALLLFCFFKIQQPLAAGSETVQIKESFKCNALK